MEEETPAQSCLPVTGFGIFKMIRTEDAMDGSVCSEAVSVETDIPNSDSAESQQAGLSPAKVTIVAKDGVKEGYSLSLIRKLFGDDLACLCGCLNHLLSGSSLATPYLPLKEDNVFDKLQDGVILCATVIAMPGGSLDDGQVHRGSDLKDAELGELRCLQNLNLALKSLEPLGVFTEAVEGRDFRSGRPLLISGILLQIVRVNTHRRIRCEYNRNLIYIMDDWSSDDATKQLDAMSQDEVLTRWVNYQLRKAGTDLVLTNFGSSLADSVIYSTLLNTVAPANKKSSLRSMDDIMVVKDLVLRATYVVKNAEILGIYDVITPEHIATAGKGAAMQSARNCVITVAFLGRIFASFPNIDVPFDKDSNLGPNETPIRTPDEQISEFPSREYTTAKREAIGIEFVSKTAKAYDRRDSEETLMMWLNYFGVNPFVYNLETDLCSGIVLQQVWQAIAPSYTNWGKFYEVNDPNVSKRKFQWLANCTAVMECAKQHGIQVNCSASDIATGETKSSLALVFLMMRLHSQIRRRRVCGDSVGDLDDGALVKWTNERLMEFGSSFQLKDFRDGHLSMTTALGYLGERVLVKAGRYRNAAAPTALLQGSAASEPGLRNLSSASPVDSPPLPPPPSPSPPPQKQQQWSSKASLRQGQLSLSSSEEEETAVAGGVALKEDSQDTWEMSQSPVSSRESVTASTERSEKTMKKPAKHTPLFDNRNAATTDSAANAPWLFPKSDLLCDSKERTEYATCLVTMLRRSGVSVLCRSLGPKSNSVVNRDVLLQLNAFWVCIVPSS